jgi:hypothetical protein
MTAQRPLPAQAMVLREMLRGATLKQLEWPKKTWFLIGDGGARIGMYTVREITALWRAGWITGRDDHSSRPDKNPDEFILTDEGSLAIEDLVE